MSTENIENKKFTLEGKINIFKTSPTVFQSLITTALRHIVNKLEKKDGRSFCGKFYS